MIVLKLGGSVITEKDRPETVNEEALERAASAVASAISANRAGRTGNADRLVVVHGGGSFGHHRASGYGVDEQTGTTDAGAVFSIHDAMATLNGIVLDRFHDRGVPALPIATLSCAHRDDDGALSMPTGAIECLLESGFVPVLYGDVIGHDGEGATVLSGDEIVVSLARSLDADAIGLCSTVPGVLDSEGTVIDRIESFEDVADALGGAETTDVTGGMAGKVRRLLTLEAQARIFSLADLEGFLAGESVGTEIA